MSDFKSRWVLPADLQEGDEFATWDDSIFVVMVDSKPGPGSPHPRNGRARVAFDARSAGAMGPFGRPERWEVYADEHLLVSHGTVRHMAQPGPPTCSFCGAQMTLHLRERPGSPPGNYYACTVCDPPPNRA